MADGAPAASSRADDWPRLAELLDRLLDLTPEEAAAELARLDPEVGPLRGRLERALAAARAREGPLAGSAIESWPELLGEPPEVEASPAGFGAGMVLGRWRITGELGRGGMGAVYAVERADGVFEQRAALKLLRFGVEDPVARERFQRERQILARLEHPAIARLLDGGVAPDGRPFLVLERIDGEPITAWCDLRRLGVEARLRLFAAVVEAVEFAHRNLVVHRDLKPSNVLVSASGEVKLLDFGVAKLLSESADEELTRTLVGVPLTPRYAAPEQITGGPVTTATDVYSLGVLLYELVAGAPPYRLASDSALELERRIVAGDTLPPSRAAASAGEAAAESRGSTAKRLARRLSGDLDALVLRALAKEPERRYPSAAALGQDLAAHLAGRPVAARPDSLAYRAARFVRRHRVGVAAAAALLLLLLAGLAATGVALFESRRRLAEARRAEAIKVFLVNVLAEADPAHGSRSERTLAEVLESGERRLATELTDQPRTRAELLLTLGAIERNLGHWERSTTLLEEARALTERELGSDSPEMGRVQLAIGDLHYWRDEEELALAAQERARTLFAAAGPEYRADLASATFNIGVVLRALGRYDEAIEQELAALALERDIHGAESLEAADVLDGLAILLHAAGRDTDALPRAAEALAIRRARLADDHPTLASSLETLGLVENGLGRPVEAVEHLRQALAIRRSAYGAVHPQVLEALNDLASVLSSSGRLDEATSTRREALAMARQIYATGDSLAIEANNLAVLCYRQKDYACAEAGFREALAGWRAAFGERHPHVASARNNLGMTLLGLGRARAALSEIEGGLVLRRALLGDESVDVAQSLRNLGLVRLALGDLGGARAALEESVALSRRVYPARHPRLAEALVARSEVALARGDRAQAARDLEEAVAIRVEKLGADNPLTAEARAALARASRPHLARAD